MPIVTPRTWVAGDVLTAAQLNVDVRDNVTFLANPPACRVYHNANQAIPDATETSVAFNSERYDTNTMHDTVTNNSRITFNVAGLYDVKFTGEMPAGADYNVAYAMLRVNGATYIDKTFDAPTNFINWSLKLGATWKFAAADYVEVRIYHDNTANTARNLLASASYSPEFSAEWIGLG